MEIDPFIRELIGEEPTREIKFLVKLFNKGAIGAGHTIAFEELTYEEIQLVAELHINEQTDYQYASDHLNGWAWLTPLGITIALGAKKLYNLE